MEHRFTIRNKNQVYHKDPELYWASINLGLEIGDLQFANHKLLAVEINRNSRYLINGINNSIKSIGKLYNLSFEDVRYASSKTTTPPNELPEGNQKI